MLNYHQIYINHNIYAKVLVLKNSRLLSTQYLPGDQFVKRKNPILSLLGGKKQCVQLLTHVYNIEEYFV